MRDNIFLDTNIFIYALTEPKCKDDIPKREIAINLLQKLINTSNMLAIASVESLSYQTYEIAFDVRQKYNISYWDSLVIASALESDCDTLYSEDMQDGLVLDGGLRVVNPF